MKRYTLEDIMSKDVDRPPKTLDKARLKFGSGVVAARKAYFWFYGEEALERQLEKKNNGRAP